jgi:D-sedoheptulose 7-phosphate isomerase
VTEDELAAIAARSAALQQAFVAENAGLLCAVGQRLVEAFAAGAKLLAFGNGGSAADAQHLVAELVVRYERDRVGLPAIALNTDVSVLTAASNDLGYAEVFRRQIEALGRPGDVALGITTSGRSLNVVQALRYARERGLHTIGLTGRGGGELRGLVHDLIDVPGDSTARTQEVHGLVIHLLCQMVEEAQGA